MRRRAVGVASRNVGYLGSIQLDVGLTARRARRTAEAGRVEGTGKVTLPKAPDAAQILKPTQLAQKLAATGWSPGVCRLAAQRS